LVVVSANTLGIDSGRQVDHEQTEETSKQAANFGLLEGTSRPAQGWGIVGHIEQNRIWIIGRLCCCDNMEHCTVVYDNSNKLEDINQDDESILVVLLV
jgi:hypothetical protein